MLLAVSIGITIREARQAMRDTGSVEHHQGFHALAASEERSRRMDGKLTTRLTPCSVLV